MHFVSQKRSGFVRSALFCGAVLLGMFSHRLHAQELVASNLKVLPDFKVDQLYTVPKEPQGSWVSMCTDPQGRLIVSDQYGKLYRLTLPPVNERAEPKIEPINLEIGAAQGLLYAFDSLYVMVNDERYQGRGLYRVRDTDHDDQFDSVQLLRKLEGGGEHGPHAILLSPDKQSLYVVIGNQTKLTEIDDSRVPLHWGEDQLLPRLWDDRFMKGVLAPGGWIARVDPHGRNWELIAHGFRNEYDAAFNHHGELFTFDADMEWDLNTPWYRPTRVNHVISGADFGWRSGAAKLPEYYIDTFGAVVNIGPGSPTGVVFGYGAKFPEKYQKALFICDWSFGKMYAVHLEPEGSTYQAQFEEFITGQPLALTDLVINPKDGAMYFAVGGRRTQSALYRVTYTGSESTEPARLRNREARARARRHELEAFHGRKDPAAIDLAWDYLDSEDRALRHAARIALEWQDPTYWQERALNEDDPRKSIAALVALSRVSAKDQPHRGEDYPQPSKNLQARILASLARIDWNDLEQGDQLDLLRAYELCFTRLGQPDEATRKKLIARFEPLYPAKTRELNAELGPLLVYLEAPSAAQKLVHMLQTAPTQEEQIDTARMLRALDTGWTPELREQYLKWFLRAANFKGGASLATFLNNIKAQSVATMSDAAKSQFKSLIEAQPEIKSPYQALLEREFVKEYTVQGLAPVIEQGLKGDRDFQRGRTIFGQAGCAACHRFDNEGAAVGPDLTNVAGRFGPRDLLESIINPNKEISDQYGAIVIKKKNGEVVTGRVGNLNGDVLMVIENMFAPNDFTNVKRQEIESIEPSTVSMMPEGLLNYFTEEEIQDLMAYLLSRGDRTARMFR